MSKEKDKLMVEAICNGTVLDHIPSDKLFAIVALLQLEKSTTPITIGNNFESRRVGSKGVIKITDRFFTEEEVQRIAILAPSIHLNTIRNYEVIDKRPLKLPTEVCDLVRCPNLKCITNAEPMSTKFMVAKHGDEVRLSCHYCGRSISSQDCELL